MHERRPPLDGRALRGALAALGAVVLTACAALPGRSAPVAPLAASAVPGKVTVQGRGGAVSEATEARDIARLKAEGRPELLQRHLGLLAAAGDVNLYRGTSARLLVDGPATFAAMKAAIGAARHRVLVEFYIVEDEGVAAQVGELLKRKAAEGVKVSLLYDAVGSLSTDKAFFDGLRQAGVSVCSFNPVNPTERPGSWGLVTRNHRKLLLVDADVAFTGGINLSNVYATGSSGSGRGSGGSGGLFGSSGSGGASRKATAAAPPAAAASAPLDTGWRDTQVELRGPVVNGMAALFRESWTRQKCEGELPPAPPPRQAEAGDRVVKLVGADPTQGDPVNPTYRHLLRAVEASRESVRLTMAYFAPGQDMIDVLSAAARRGVKVELVLPGQSDVKLVLHAARSYYGQLLDAGVRIHEMQHAVMHAKTAVIDGVFSTVGSSNLDWRSIVGNHEIDVIVLGDDFGQAMQALFAQDVAASRPVEAAQWRDRGLRQRFMEGIGRLLEPLL